MPFILWFGFGLKSDATYGHGVFSATKMGPGVQPMGHPGLFCPGKVSSKHCQLFNVGGESLCPKMWRMSIWNEVSLVGLWEQREKFTAGFFFFFLQ